MNTAFYVTCSVLLLACSYGYWQQRRHLNRDHARIIREALQAELDAMIEDYHCAKWESELTR